MADKFDEFMMKERAMCEYFLNKHGFYDKMPENINVGPDEYYDVPNDEWTNIYGKRPDWHSVCKKGTTITCYDTLAIVYKYFGDEEKAQKMLRYLSTIEMPTSKYQGLPEKCDEAWNILIDQGIWQLKKAIQLNMSHKDTDWARQCFEWCAENCFLSEKTLSDMIGDENYDFIAVAFLWRGYALLMLGRVEEAYELFKEVRPYLDRYKKLGVEMWRTVEYALPKALLPLCEYKLEPTEDNRRKAKKGLEECVKSLREYRDRLEAYLYYYHLKETFPEVYDDTKATTVVKTISPIKKKTSKKPAIPNESYAPGSVIVCDDMRAYLETLGSQQEFEDYIKNIKNIDKTGEYPHLSGLMEVYVADGRIEPEPLIEECVNLLRTQNIDPVLRKKTGMILEVAKYAQEKDSTVAIYFDPEA